MIWFLGKTFLYCSRIILMSGILISGFYCICYYPYVIVKIVRFAPEYFNSWG